MITAIILAAGQSTRMGSPKMVLPWGNMTVIEHVVSVFSKAGIDDILVVTGGAHEQVESVILQCRKKYPVRSVYNEKYKSGDMLTSIQCGLRHIADKSVGAAMIGLGDQPQVQEGSVRRVCDAFLETESKIVVPSYKMRRGHPWLVARPLWDEILKMRSPQSPRDLLNAHQAEIQYVNLDDPNILADLDTPEEYRKWQP